MSVQGGLNTAIITLEQGRLAPSDKQYSESRLSLSADYSSNSEGERISLCGV